MEFTPKRDIAKQFLMLVANGEIEKAFANYTASEFIHHNPFYSKEKEALIDGMKTKFKEFYNIKILRLIEQNDLVMAHSVIKNKSNQTEIVSVYIFRFNDHLISEFWDIFQEVPNSHLNQNGMY